MVRLFVLGGIGMVLLAGVPGHGGEIVTVEVPRLTSPLPAMACQGPADIGPPPNTTPLGSICSER